MEDLKGKVFDRLTVKEYAGRNYENRPLWKCECECGNEVIRIGRNLKNSRTYKSCGCYIGDAKIQHGGAYTRLYHIWKGIRKRCNNPNSSGAKYYYHKGIKICDEWNDFIVFREWALNNGYSDDLTIDRINPNGNYNPDNCQWITHSENSRRGRGIL